MFAYCNNNPVMCADPTGEFLWFIPLIPIVVIPFLLGGCSANNSSQDEYALAHYIEKIRGATDLNIEEASAGSYNCLGNAIGKQISEDLFGYSQGDSAEEVFSQVKRFLGSKNVRRLYSIHAPLERDEYMVALKTCSSDYHFIRLTEKGWYNKVGQEPGSYVSATYVAGSVWNPLEQPYGNKINLTPNGYTYTSSTIYFAVKVGWDQQ